MLARMPMTLPPDTELVTWLRARDEAAFALVLDQWSPGMLRLARSFVSTPDSAAEVVQETWLAVVRGIDGFEGRSALRTWVYRILVNTAKRRGAREARSVPLSSLGPTAEDTGPTVDPGRFRGSDDPYPGHWKEFPAPWTSFPPSPERHALGTELRALLETALTDLPARQRVVITLRDVEGHSAEEVAEALGVTPGNQRVLLHRARAFVRGRLEGYRDA
jgi:RNA polymerase sigma-70 factor (ECF subfamily)